MPDDLERLDDDLAAGRVDATAYRRRRDALLAAEAPPPAAAANADPPAPTTEEPPGGGGGGGGVTPEPAAPVEPRPPDPAPPASPAPALPPSLTPLPSASVASPPPRSDDPFPPPFRWDDRTSRPSAEGTASPAERTQVVPGAAVGRMRSVPVPPHLTMPPWGTGPADPPRPVPRESRARMQGPEVFGPGPGVRPVAVLGTVFVVVLALAVLVASILL